MTTDEAIPLEDLFAATLTAIRDGDTATVEENTTRIAAACGTDVDDLRDQLTDAAGDPAAAEDLLDDLQTMGALMGFTPVVRRREYNFAIPDRPIVDTTPGAASDPADLRGVFL